MIAQVMSGSGELALCDNGATVNCDKHGVGVVTGTEQALSGQGLVIGDENATLHANVTRLHALCIVDKNGVEVHRLIRMYSTPTSISTILSESEEVNDRSTNITWDSAHGRAWHLSEGTSLHLTMTANGLGLAAH